MREYKFRAWDGEKIIYQDNNGFFDKVKIDRYPTLQTIQFHSASIYCKIMQFTGLKDLQGKEVYEGDIVDYGNGRNKVVEFIDGCFCICGITAMPKLMTLYPVIGNIYENPELLK